MAKTKKENLVINQVIIKAPQRRVYDVGDWRSAMRSADIGRAKYLYDLFDEILIDGVLADAIDKRIDAVLNAGVTFVDSNNEEVSEITDLINSSAGEVMLSSILSQRFFGRSGFEISLENGFQCETIKPKYIDLQHRAILLDDLGDKSVSYEDNNQILILGRPLEYGLLLKAAPFAIYKRGGFGDYAQWIELFGMPQRIGKYNTYDPESRALLEQAFKNAGSAPYLIVPKESDIETKEGSTGSGESYNEFREACNEEMLITILGQTLTTVQGERGARSLGEVHMEVEQSKHDSDIRFVERVLNERVIPMLEARGLNLKGGRFMFPKEAEPLSVADIVNLSEIIQIPASFVHEKYGIPMPKDGEQIARKQTQEVIEVTKNDEPPQEPTARKKIQEVRNDDERGFLRRVWDFFVGAPQVGATLSGDAPTLKDAKTLDERLIARTPNSKGFDAELFEYLSNGLITAFREGWDSPDAKIKMADKASMTLQYSIQDDALKTAMEMNLYRFSAAKTLAEVQALNQLFRESSNYKDFERKATGVCEAFNKQWQKTEYDTAYNSALSTSRYRQMLRLTKGAPYWEYVTARDERVRETHRGLDGVILRFDDERWQKIYPPNGWRCRCVVSSLTRNQAKGVNIKEMQDRVDAYLETNDWQKAKAQGWGVNRALIGEVFTANQFYIRKFKDKAAKRLRGLYYNDYGLDSFGKRLAAAEQILKEYEGDPADWFKAHMVISESNDAILKDYLGRQVVMSQKVFSKHTQGKYTNDFERRPQLLGCIEDVLTNPDEIWLNDYTTEDDFRNLCFIKFYKGKVVNVVCEITDNLKYNIATWFEIKQESKKKQHNYTERIKDTRWRYRRGLLIKKS